GGRMNGYIFSERVRKTLAMSRENAYRLGHEYVGTEHLLLGIIAEGGGVASAVLQNLSIDTGELKQRIEAAITTSANSGSSRGDLPYTSRAKKVLEIAMAESQELKHSYIGTEHLLLGLIREERGVAAQMLVREGATLDVVRAETLRLLGPPRANS
ncbi:MAG TPA: Clp protease N-terminal domain-containing protein, partial [Gemmatimonas sp.]|nr:Clp protease N-terminal domain-containing protein [Gemmatimonas sp.]